MFVMYRSPGKTARWLLGVDPKKKESEVPSEVRSLKRRLQEACAGQEITRRARFSPSGRPYYRIAEPVAKLWFDQTYQNQEAICAYSRF